MTTLISREKLSKYFGWKTRENVVVLDILAVDNFEFHKKNCQKKFWWKKSWKCWGFVKIEFLDKNLTFRIVWISRISRIRDKFFMMFRLSCCSQNQDGLRLIRISYGAVLSVSSKKPLQVWSWMIYWFSLKLLNNYFWLE